VNTSTSSRSASLNGLWDFVFLGKCDLEEFRPASVARWEKALVPSAFDALPQHAGKRGAAAYRRWIAVPPGRSAKLEFGAVSMWCRIFLDGKAVRDHACGYAPFEIAVPPSELALREVVVLADNRFDFARVPMHEEYFDFYQYGGIIRDVRLRVLPESGPFLRSVHVIPTEGYREGWVKVRIRWGGEASGDIDLALSFDCSGREVARVTAEDGSTELELSVPEPDLWSPENPHRHELAVAVLEGGREVDQMTVRFGLRRVEARDAALWLNGKKLILKGVNRHEWHPNFGPCTPELQMAADLQILKDLGCNFVRGCHYPQDQRFLELCDEMGFLVWEENLGWGQREKTFASDKFRHDHRESLRAMVEASMNHPSVIFWGFLNEAGSDKPYVREIFEESAAFLRSLDPSRLVTYASMYVETDLHYDVADVISINIYPGWYGCEGEEHPLDLIAPRLETCLRVISERGFGGKPVLVSEIGAEGLYGWRDAHHDFFTEEFQAAYLQRACEAVLNEARCCGIAIWHFSDVRTYGGGWSLKRPRTFNNKGILDEYRRPKAACGVVREIFRRPLP